MGLDALFSQYKPTGAVGGMFAGMEQGRTLADAASTIRNRDQQTLNDEQMLPMNLAKAGAEIDQMTMANDKTRAIQTPEYLAQEGGNALQQSKLTGEQLKQAMEMLPFDKFIESQNKQSQAGAQFLQGISTAIRTGQIDQAYQQFLPMMKDATQKAELEKYYKAAKSGPQGAQQVLAELDKQIYALTNTMNQANLPQQQQRYLASLQYIADKYRADASVRASANGSQPKEQTIDNKLVEISEELTHTRDPARRKILIDQYNYLKEAKYVKQTTEQFGDVELNKRVGPPLTPETATPTQQQQIIKLQ